MGTPQRWTVTAGAVALLSGLLLGCGDDEPAESDPGIRLGSSRILGPGLGLGEWSDDGSGDRRVLGVADDEADAEEPGARTVVALVEICAPPDRPDVPAGSDWRLILDDGGFAAAAGPLRPTTGGSPALPASGRIGPEQCAFADISFDVPAGAVTVGAMFHTAAAGDVRWSWEPKDTVV